MTCVITLSNVMDTHNNPQFSIEDIHELKWDKSKGLMLRKIRTEKGLTMKQLSQKITSLGIDCTLEYIGALEHGRSNAIASDKFIGLIRSLGVSPNYFSSKK
jgi:hypothetical protein